jgi:succinoglycan biosynthesis protein ExoM
MIINNIEETNNISISIAICTYKRADLLAKCLASVINQKTNHNFEIIVVDNDKNGTAKDVVSSFIKNEKNILISYYIEGRQGISYSRNMAVSQSSNPLLVFIDDDEYAANDWLEQLVLCLNVYEADVVLGEVIYEIPDTFSGYIKKSLYFYRKKRVNGFLAKNNEGYTGNTLMKLEILKLREKPFLEKYNKTGGEDSEFFNYILSQGFKIVFSTEAKIFEIQDQKRLKPIWYFRRGYHAGWNYCNNVIVENKPIQAVFKVGRSFVGGLLLSFVLFFRSIFNFNKYFLVLLNRVGIQLGKVGFFLGIKIEIYNE